MWSGLIKLIQTVVNSAATGIGNAWISISNFFVKYVTTPISSAWTALTGFLSKTLSNVTTGISNIWNGMVTTVRNALRGMVQFAASALNGIINALNRVINGINVARRAMGIYPDLGIITPIQVPAFAEGGVVNRPTLAMVGEGGEREWIIPESKMARASANFLAGARGSAVLNGNGSGGAMPQINITTGPIMQTPDGQQWVSLADLERAQRQTVATVMGQLRTPAGRYAVGVR
jgi:SLT domain-containing protein